MIKEYIKKVVEKKDLSYSEAKEAFISILDSKVSPVQVSAFLIGLRMKGESLYEILALSEIMRERSVKLNVKEGKEDFVLDTCGTGGKPIKTFNISTCTAFVVSSLGIKVAKHGNRSFSGRCGSADVIEKLGINISLLPDIVEKAVKSIGIGFIYAPLFHPAMKQVAGLRKEIGVRTIFNLAGPLTNPAGADIQVLGVYSPDLTEKIAGVLKNLGLRKAMVIWGEDVCDEVSITGKTKVSELKQGEVSTYYLTPEDFGLSPEKFSELKGGTVSENMDSILSVLGGEPSAKLNIVLANASLCLVLSGLAENFKQGVSLALSSIKSGKALGKLEELKAFLSPSSKNK